MKSAAAAANRIRTELKALFGWTSRDVSVRADSYSMGSTIRVTIKTARVIAAEVERIANSEEDVRRDHTGEILCGGNRFVDVSYSDELMAALAVPESVLPTGADSTRFAGYWLSRCDGYGQNDENGYFFRADPRWENADIVSDRIIASGRDCFRRMLGIKAHERRQRYAARLAA